MSFNAAAWNSASVNVFLPATAAALGIVNNNFCASGLFKLPDKIFKKPFRVSGAILSSIICVPSAALIWALAASSPMSARCCNSYLKAA